MSISVTQVTRATGETTYLIRDDGTRRRVATVTSDGFFYADPARFHGYVVDADLGIRDPASDFGRAALGAVAHYETWNRQPARSHQ